LRRCVRQGRVRCRCPPTTTFGACGLAFPERQDRGEVEAFEAPPLRNLLQALEEAAGLPLLLVGLGTDEGADAVPILGRGAHDCLDEVAVVLQTAQYAALGGLVGEVAVGEEPEQVKMAGRMRGSLGRGQGVKAFGKCDDVGEPDLKPLRFAKRLPERAEPSHWRRSALLTAEAANKFTFADRAELAQGGCLRERTVGNNGDCPEVLVAPGDRCFLLVRE